MHFWYLVLSFILASTYLLSQALHKDILQICTYLLVGLSPHCSLSKLYLLNVAYLLAELSSDLIAHGAVGNLQINFYEPPITITLSHIDHLNISSAMYIWIVAKLVYFIYCKLCIWILRLKVMVLLALFLSLYQISFKACLFYNFWGLLFQFRNNFIHQYHPRKQ